jgi:hypothetical protein
MKALGVPVIQGQEVRVKTALIFVLNASRKHFLPNKLSHLTSACAGRKWQAPMSSVLDLKK